MKPLFLVVLVGLIAGRCWSADSKVPDLAELKLAAERGDPKAQYAYGKTCRSHVQFGEAENWFRLAATQGLPEAEHAYGEILMLQTSKTVNGKTVYRKPDPAQAVSWYVKAVNHGYKPALLSLAHCYKDGKGVKQNNVEAYKYYTAADKLGDLTAKIYRDSLILKMSSAEVQQGQNAAEVVLASFPKK
ncbi:MAG: Secretory immunoglobulin A-binding protein EsiB [Verrucomicrobiae bacterium]|nr:Secretory immunoglobulin A-binding protein EsiB [Verrucomicrobiae bacterium]